MQKHEKIYKEFNKLLRNRNNSLQELKNIFVMHYQKHPHYEFEIAVLRSIFHNQHTEIFKFLFENGFSYSIDNSILKSFSKKITNEEHKSYFIYSSLKFIAGHIERPECIPSHFLQNNYISDNDIINFDNYPSIIKKRIIFQMTVYSDNVNDSLYDDFFEKIKNDKHLFLFLKFIIFSTHKSYLCSKFIDYIAKKSFFDEFNLEIIINKYDLKDFVIQQIEKNIDKKETLKIIQEPLKRLIKYKSHKISHSMIKIIFDSKDKNLIRYLSHQFFISIKDNALNIPDDIISYFFTFDFPEIIVKYKQFIFNRNFNEDNNKHYTEKVYRVFFDNIEVIKEKHHQKFMNNLDYLDEKIRTFFLIENF